jgi:1D-myo-inositol-tetrakisphosphate 5-kinase/inositol-polyphosphate multikinase
MSSQGLPRDTLILVLRAMRAEIAAIREILASAELRMVGASLLIIYEADWEQAAEAIKKYIEGQQEEIIAKKQEEEEIAAEKEEEEEEDEEGEDDEDSESDGPPKLGPPFIVKLIDFAHTRLKPGQGPDEGVLRGLDTLLKLLDDRLESIIASPPPSVPAA